jgi:hypothetical protein
MEWQARRHALEYELRMATSHIEHSPVMYFEGSRAEATLPETIGSFLVWIRLSRESRVASPFRSRNNFLKPLVAGSRFRHLQRVGSMLDALTSESWAGINFSRIESILKRFSVRSGFGSLYVCKS